MRISDWSSDVCSSDLSRPDESRCRDYQRGSRRSCPFRDHRTGGNGRGGPHGLPGCADAQRQRCGGMGMNGLLAITNGRLVDPAGQTGERGVLLLKGDSILAAGQVDVPAEAEIIDAGGLLIAPGIIDLCVFKTDKPAFHFGGITRAALMPDQSPPLDDPGLVQHAARAGKPDFWVHPLAAATRGLQGREMAEIGLMKAAGAKAVATGRHWIADSGIMLRVLQYASALGLTVIVHAEDSGLAAHAVATSGETATRLGLPSAPACAEAIAIARDIMLAREAKAAIHLRNVTTRQGFDLIRAAKAQGIVVTSGISPAYLFLSETNGQAEGREKAG